MLRLRRSEHKLDLPLRLPLQLGAAATGASLPDQGYGSERSPEDEHPPPFALLPHQRRPASVQHVRFADGVAGGGDGAATTDFGFVTPGTSVVLGLFGWRMGDDVRIECDARQNFLFRLYASIRFGYSYFLCICKRSTPPTIQSALCVCISRKIEQAVVGSST